MKLIIAGASGFVGREILRQALSDAQIDSIVTLDRRAIDVEGSEKLASFVLSEAEFLDYPPIVRQKIANADACIWTIAVARTKSLTTPYEIVKRSSYDYPMAGIRALSEGISTGRAAAFVYFSGLVVTRDLSAPYQGPPEFKLYSELRNKIEIDLVNYASSNSNLIRLCCLRPGYISGYRSEDYVVPTIPAFVPTIPVEVCVAACLKQCIKGIEKDPLMNDEIVKIGKEVLQEEAGRQTRQT